MPVRVLKFGGTSVETPAHILAAARRILACRAAGDPIVVVVSAMGQTTDELIRLAHRVSLSPSRRELDMLLTAGERISMTLLAMCLESLGCPAISFTGSQSGIVTDSRHADARIRTVRGLRLEEELARGRVVIVAGFQGVSKEREVTTLGRGGSDTTAVALAIRLGAPSCEILTDVPGVLSADPRIVPGARKLDALGYEPMIVLSHLGGRVLFRRAVILARKYGMPIEVLSSAVTDPGTRIPADDNVPLVPLPSPKPLSEEESMESDRVLGVALESPVHWVRVVLPPELDGAAGHAVPDQGSPLFLTFHRGALPDGSRLIEFVAAPDPELEPWLEPDRWGPSAKITVEREAALLSVVGEGVLSFGDVLRRAAGALTRRSIPIWGIQTATLSVSLLIPATHGAEAARALHADLVEQA